MKTGYSMSPVRIVGSAIKDGKVHAQIEQCEETEADFWGVYRHEPDGTVEWMADCEGKKSAEAVLKALVDALGGGQ